MKRKTIAKIIGGILGVLLILVVINFIPTLSLKTSHMNVYEGKWVNVYYETEQVAAEDTFRLADERAEELAQLLGITEKPDINIYIYDNQYTMQMKKYGMIVLALNLDWYIGDNIGTDVILTSPARPGKVHSYDENKYAVLHEMVHAYNSVLNEKMSYWVDNGLAGYLSEQIPRKDLYEIDRVPSIEETRVKGLLAPKKFADFKGYQYSYTYIEYLVQKYSWDKVSQFARNGDFISCFNTTEEEIYKEWITYIKENYSN